MKASFLLFFSLVIAVYFSLNYYIYVRGLQAIPQGSSFRTYYKFLFLLLALSFIASRFLERIAINKISEVMMWIGNIWLGAILYLFLFILLLDLLRLANTLFHIFPAQVILNYAKYKLFTFYTVIGLTSLILLGSYINANSVKINELDLYTDKSGGNLSELKIALVSDIHLGTMIKNSKVDKMVNAINSLNPDLVLFAGDIVDEDLASVIAYDIGKNLVNLKSRYGSYAVTGNHEYIGGGDKSVEYIEKFGIKYLRDETILIDSSFYLTGREDRDSKRFAGKERKSLKELTADLDKKYPLIVMNHQPFNLEEAVSAGADLHLSGHTHHGQMWPLNYITEMVYEVSRGYKKIQNTHFYVSTGFGSWGPPMRSGNRPEIVFIKLKFKNKS